MAPRRVLLIDDEDDVRELAQISLEMVANWHVTTARSGAEGLVLAASNRPDAIVLDVLMPGMDGSVTFGHLQANPATRHIPVVLLTAKVVDPATDRFALEVATLSPNRSTPCACLARLPARSAGSPEVPQ